MPKRVPGIIAVAVGVVLMLIAVLDPRDDAFELGRVPVAVGALVFVFTGVALLLQSLHQRYKPAMQTLIGTLIIGAFAVLSGIVTLGSPFLMLFSFLPCLALTGLGIGATIRDFRAAWRDSRKDCS